MNWDMTGADRLLPESAPSMMHASVPTEDVVS